MQNTIQQEERPALSSLMTSDYGSTWLIRINDLGTRMVFFAFDVAPHHRLASPDQFRYGRHHLAKSHERTQSPRIHRFVMMTNGTELFVSFQLEKPLARTNESSNLRAAIKEEQETEGEESR
ncbi:hypothetical protein SeLEV6574_g00471 [Synchytrium endobioticum]|uniref:Uncharacterized protein n=1 Tax=Synchytrium endobioticum TaxID=286115 RepID=A0A507DHE1_9FUNG|nr:hypothetical protein SeLEV6574_g00471 [Synchytrium endobioticum]